MTNFAENDTGSRIHSPDLAESIAHAAENDVATCAHVHVESWRKFGGTLLWRCLDCGADSRDDTTVLPPGQVPCVCGEQMTEPYPNDTGEHSTTECPIPPEEGRRG